MSSARGRRLGLARRASAASSSAALTSVRSASGDGAELAQDGRDEAAVLLLEQDGEQVFGGDLRVAPARERA